MRVKALLLCLIFLAATAGCQEAEPAKAVRKGKRTSDGVGGGAPATSAPEAAPGEDAAPAQGEVWEEVASYSGRGMQDTGVFVIGRDDWRVTFSAASDPTNAGVTAFLRLQGEDPESPTDHGRVEGQGPGPFKQEFSNPGAYFFHIHAENLDWTIKIEQRTEQFLYDQDF